MDERVDRTRPEVEPAPLSSPVRPARRTHLARWLILLLVLAAAAGAVWYWRTHPAAQPSGRAAGRSGAQTPPQPVGAATIDKGDIRIILNQLGTVTSLDTVTVMTQINGQLVDVGFKEGQVVKKGDFLAQIDPRPYQVALGQAQGTLARDQGLLAQAQGDLKRYQMLGRQDSIAQQQLDDQRYLVQQDTGTVQADQGTVDNAKLNLAYCHIVSPIDGQVGLRQVDPGNYVQTSSTSGIVVITQMQPISVVFSVPEENVSEIIRRMQSGATLSVSAYDQANVKLVATGRLATIDNQVDTTTGTVKLRALFDNPDESLYPNQFVNARLLLDTMKDIVRVPVPAVQRGEPGTYVYVVNANNTVSVRPVKLGPTDGGYEAVLSGLQPGERIVTDGTDRLRDGAAVTVPGPAQARGPGRPPAQGGQSTQTVQPASPGASSTPATATQPGAKDHPRLGGRPNQAEPGQAGETPEPLQAPARPDQGQHGASSVQ
jgi:multidrug efflux system membrane fusion protein